jgi:alpha-galactosidase
MDLKIAVIGVGSFVFGPSILSQALREHRLDGIALALVDVDPEVLAGMAGVGRRMAHESGVRATITTHTDRALALEGADFVLCAAARELHRRFAMDCEIVDRYVPGHLISEFGGIAGISYSLRQIAVIEAIAADMRWLCPDAWLLVSSNPLPRVCQAAHELGVRTAGFCSASLEGYSMLWHLWEGERLTYPFAAARERWSVTMAGLNHFCWVTELRDRATGADLLPELRERCRDGASSSFARSDALCRETGYLLVPNDHHTQDFLPPAGATPSRTTPAHGSPAERQARLARLAEIAAGRAPLDELLATPSWERPIDLVAAMARDTSIPLHALNLANTGQIPNLPHGVFVETPATATPGGPVPETIVLPEAVVPLCERTAYVTDLIVRAARRRERRLVHAAVEADPTVVDRRAGIAAIDACLAAHAEILPAYD